MIPQQHAKANNIVHEIDDIMDFESSLDARMIVVCKHLPEQLRTNITAQIDDYYSGRMAELLLEYDAL